jgi:hypothetical protein
MTREQIEALRDEAPDKPGTFRTSNLTIRALCELALEGLEARAMAEEQAIIARLTDEPRREENETYVPEVAALRAENERLQRERDQAEMRVAAALSFIPNDVSIGQLRDAEQKAHAVRAENERLRFHLEDAAESMNCKGNGPNAAHYCQNCSTDMDGPRYRARRALERKPE